MLGNKNSSLTLPQLRNFWALPVKRSLRSRGGENFPLIRCRPGRGNSAAHGGSNCPKFLSSWKKLAMGASQRGAIYFPMHGVVG
jgi:hypothetical protein